MATKSVEKSSKKPAAAKAKPEKKPAANAKETTARRPAPAAAKQASRAGLQSNGKAPAKPATVAKPPAPKPAPAKSLASKPAPSKSAAAKSQPAKDAAKGKTAAAKTAVTKASPAAVKKSEPKKQAAAPQAATSKAAEKKSAEKPTAKSGAPKAAQQESAKLKKPAAEIAKPKAAAPKLAPAAKATPEKKAAAKNPAEKKADVKGAQKSSAPPQTDAAGKKPGGKAAKSSGAAKTMTESPAMKKPLVGQKPRSDRPASMTLGAPLTFMPKANQSVNESTVKPSPASQEAKLDFKVNDHVVYPAHGVGRIVGIERQVIAGIVNELFLIDFEQEKMKLRVPTAKAKAVGMRALSDPGLVKKAIETLKGRARIKRTMWSRRAQEYEAKINSGDIISVAEVVRDLFRASDQPEQSYSERQLFEAALDRLAREVAAVHKSDLAAALAELEGALQQKKAA